MSYNKVILLGNVTRDVVGKTISSGQKVVELGLAVNRTYTQDGEKKEEVTFVDVTFWGKQAETIGKYVTKGMPILIEGRLKMDSWEDDSGNKRQKLKVSGDSFQFVGSKKESSETLETKKTTKISKPKPVDSEGDSMPSSFDDEIPF